MPNLSAERALLGGLLFNGDAVWSVLEIINADDLSVAAHRCLFNAIVETVKAGRPSDFILLTDTLEKNGELEKVGGVSAITELIESTPSAANITHYAELIRVESLRIRSKNELAAAYHRIEKAEDPEKESFETQRRLGEICGGRQTEDDMPSAVAGAMEYIEKLQNKDKPGLSFGREFPLLNSLTFGVQPELIVLAGRPSLGKTALADQWLENLEAQNVKPLFFSLEMSREQIARRRIYRRIGYEVRDFHQKQILGGRINPSLITQAAAEVSQSVARLYDSITGIDKIVAVLRSKAMSGACGVFVVDYLQLLRGNRNRGETRNDEIGKIIRDFKLAVQDLKITGVVLSQLSRAPEKENREPNLSDLRDSGSIEQDADKVIFIHRKRNKETGKLELEGDLILAKSRDGDCGRVKIKFHGPSLTFKERDDNRQPDLYNGVKGGYEHRDFNDPEER